MASPRSTNRTLAIAVLVGIVAVAVTAAAVDMGTAGAPAGSAVPTTGLAARSTSPPTEPPSDPTSEPSVDTESPSASARATASPELIPALPVPVDRIATRVVVQALGIDLPVTRQTTPYPACGVAMYLTDLLQPGAGGVTYLYAHAQAGNFLPILHESLINDGARMLGMTIDVYTGDSLRFSYRVVEVRRHVTSLDGAFAWAGESVFLQTSEGPGASNPKLQVVGEVTGMGPATFEASHPEPRPLVCR